MEMGVVHIMIVDVRLVIVASLEFQRVFVVLKPNLLRIEAVCFVLEILLQPLIELASSCYEPILLEIATDLVIFLTHKTLVSRLKPQLRAESP